MEDNNLWQLYVTVEQQGFPMEHLVYGFASEESAITGQRLLIEASDYMNSALVSSSIVGQ
jgi:hypothetical protein